MPFDDVVPGDAGRALQQVLRRALNGVYAENVDRHDPEDMGDGNRAFSGNLADNVPHRVMQALEQYRSRWSVPVRREPGHGLRLRIAGSLVCFYKAPPGASTVDHLDLGDSDFKQLITRRNAAHGQRVLDFEGNDARGIDELDDGQDIVIVAHFGSFETGFSHAIAGVPYRVDNRIAWDWTAELVDDGEDFGLALDPSGDTPPVDDRGGFGLELRPDADRRSGSE